jgi:hypothetical protein
MASLPSLPPKKQRFYVSATEESVPPPPNQLQKPTTGVTTTAQLPTNPSSPHFGKPRRGAVLTYPNAPYFVVGGGIPIRIHILMPYGAETRDKLSYALLTMHLIFDTTVAEYGKGRTFVGSSGQSHFSEGKENREEEGHQMTQWLEAFLVKRGNRNADYK